MSEKIKLVRNDTRPALAVTITDRETGLPVDVTGATVRLKFRAVGATALAASLVAIPVAPASGSVLFDWTDEPTALAGPAGDYEGEIETTFADGSVQTVFEVLRFRMREDF